MQRGVVICVLLGNALVVLTTDGLVLIALIRGANKSWQHRGSGVGAAIRTGLGPPLFAALGATAIQRVVARWLLHTVETGRASAWLERSERWLKASASDPNECQ